MVEHNPDGNDAGSLPGTARKTHLRATVGPYIVLRSQDMVYLTVRGEGLRETSEGGTAAWVADGGPGRLIVEFPPQHIAEAVLITPMTSSQARLAGPSSLHFEVTSQRIKLTTEGVLAAMADLPLVVEPREQGKASTLELPWRLLLALQTDPRCAHRLTPKSSGDGVTELWHTRLLGPGGMYAAVYPFARLAAEASFANQTPLKDKDLSDIAKAGKENPNTEIAVERLILSAFGAWFSGSVSWPQQVPPLDWTHRAAMARDYYVRLEKAGVLFPFGHGAAVVELTERRFDTQPKPLAGLRKTRILIVTEPTREYGITTPYDPAFPFQRIEIVEPRLVTPLDDPRGQPYYWPMRGGQPVLFSIRATAGTEVIEMQLPLLFSELGQQADDLIRFFAQGLSGHPPTTLVGRFMPIAMNNQHEPLEGAIQQVRSLTFGGKAVTSDPGFHPRITGLEVELPAAKQLLGSTQVLQATLSRQLLASTPSNPPDVLLDFPALALRFGSAKTGVVAAPNVAVNQISRTKGPIVADLPTDPANLFDPAAKLLGVVPLSEIVGLGMGQQPTITWQEGPHPTAIMQWAQALSARREYPGPFVPVTGSKVTLKVESTLVEGKPPMVTTYGTVTNFEVHIPSQANALVVLAFASLTFHVETGGLPTTQIVIDSVQLGGNLGFIQRLSEYMKSVANSGPKYDVTTEEIRAAYAIAIPPLSLGVFMLRNLYLQAGVTLSLVNKPITMDFAFGTRDNQFLVTVSGFGGGGYLELGIGAGGDDGGLQRAVGGIQFGASVAMDFGVAAGEVHVFGGVVFAKVGRDIEITGYLRIGGMVRVLGLISVSVELTVSLTYNSARNELRGAAKLIITVDLTFWSTSVEIRCEKSFSTADRALTGATSPLMAFSGSSVEDALGPVGESFPWQSYCRAFAGE